MRSIIYFLQIEDYFKEKEEKRIASMKLKKIQKEDEKMKKDSKQAFLTPEKKRYREQVAKETVLIGGAISFVFMGLGALFVVQSASLYQGMASFSIAFIGSLIVAAVGVYMAYRIGEKTRKILNW